MERRKKNQKFENEGDSKPVIFKPLGILVSLGYFTADQGWEVHRALYGFLESPKLWSDYRDQELEEMRAGKLHIQQLESEFCMWLMKKPEDKAIYGALVTYVGDRLLLGEGVAELCVKEIQKKWDNVRTKEQEAYTIPWNGIEQKSRRTLESEAGGLHEGSTTSKSRSRTREVAWKKSSSCEGGRIGAGEQARG